MKNLVVFNMPIKPYKKINPGLMIAPTLCDVLGSILKCKKVVSFNLLHSFDDKQGDLHEYVNIISDFGISFDEELKDIEHVEEYLKKIELLYRNDAIKVMSGEVLRCNCGKVEMDSDLANYNLNGDLYYRKNNAIFCKYCNTECKKYNQNNLYLEIKPNLCKEISVSPIFLKREFKNLLDIFSNKRILISKNRQDNYFLNAKGQRFNLDVDILWQMFNQVEDNKNQILIASNHQLYEMFISNYINSLFSEKNVHYIATPYLTNGENLDLEKKLYLKNVVFKKLAILYSLKWKYKTLNWNNGIFELLSKFDEFELSELYNLVLNLPFDDTCDFSLVVDKLLSDINLNKNMQALRRLRREN